MPDDSLNILSIQNKKDWIDFVKFPYRLYKNNPCWVPPILMDYKVLLNPDKHPFYRHADVQFFLARKGKKTVGRIAAIVDHSHNKIHEEKTGMFGFFECIDDHSIAKALLSAAQSWLKDRGMKRFRGPLNPSQNEECGLLMDAYDKPPVLLMPYNPPYYVQLLEQFGLKKAMDLWAYYIDSENPPPAKLVRVTESLRKKTKVIVRPVSMKDFKNEAEKVWYIYNHAWIKNWGFVPMTKPEFDHLAKNLKSAIIPDLALMAELDGKPVGFSLTLPDLNQALIHTNGRLFPAGLLKILWYSRKIDMVRIIIMGVLPEYRNLGIDSLFYIDTWRNAVARNMGRGEMSWILENNTMMNRAAKMLGAHVYKTYRMYEMKI